MENIVLQRGVISEIKKDPILFGKVAKALNIAPISLPRILYSNEPVQLTQASVMIVLREYLGKQDNELLETLETVQ